MMLWKTLDSEIRVPSIRELITKLDCLSSTVLLTNYILGNRIYFNRSCYREILNHVGTNPKEVGGLILGHVYQEGPEKRNGYPFISILCVALASEKYKNSNISLEMNSEVWGRASDYISKGMTVLGWYHSHPNLGAFFSSTDRSTQAAFFNQQYSLGLVIDPFQREDCIFTGAESDKYHSKVAIIDYELGIT